jgi:predicted N-acetyltransferase YhbS
MALLIRPETVAHYAAIADLHARAFGQRPGAALIVALLRQRRSFDPQLSLVAEIDGRVVGHVLFSPHQLRLLGHTVPAVNLAPLAVDPPYQRQGIGGRLIAEGHAIAAAKGYAVSFLLGHPEYYPRFGYHTHAYGSAQATIPGEALTGEPVEQRAPQAEDVPLLRALWQHDEAAVDFALDPGPALLDWLSPNPAIRAAVYLRDGALAGYTRIHAAEPSRPRVFLAREGAMARAMARVIAQDANVSALVLPLHPASASAAGFVQPACETWPAAMARALAPSPLDDYFAQVRAGHRPPGRLTWPVAFDLD